MALAARVSDNRDMRRALAISAVLACGSPPPAAEVVSVPAAEAGASPAHVAALASQARPFELFVSYRMCALARGKLHCRDKLAPEPLLGAPVLAGLEKVDVTSAAFGRDFGCVTTPAGEVECFGGNHFGQLGAGVREEQHPAPIVVPGVRGARRVYAGPFTVCAILEDGRVSCWGKNQQGENGSSTNYLEAARELVEPQIVRGVSNVDELALAWNTTCAAATDGRVWCWGSAKLAEQRAGGDANEIPALVPSLANAKSLTANEESFCAVRNEKVVCWGNLMMLSAGGARDELTTIPIEHAQRVSLGSLHACAIDASGAVYCFGSNTAGEIGVPVDKDRWEPLPPTRVAGIPRAVDVYAGSSNSCALTIQNEVWCWGRFDWETQDVRAPFRVAVL